MDIKTLNKIGEDLVRILRVRTIPVGIVFYENEEDIPAAFQRIEKRRPFCAVVGMARYYEIPVAITEEYIKGLCLGTDISMGYDEAPPDFGEQTAGYFAETAEGARGVLANMMTLQGKYKAVAIAPLTTIEVIPHLVQIWGNSQQMSTLAYSHTWHFGDKRVHLSTNGHGGSCYEALTVPFLKNEVTMALADAGDRRHGYASDDELILTVPINKLEQLYDGLLKNQETRHATPTVYNFEDLPFPIPPSVMAVKSPKLK